MARPNVVLMLADDMGFSDIGCYGGEIATPNLDRLARRGVRFSQFYNTARCSPSRASLLTGLHPHQAGIGVLTNDDRPRGYAGTLNDRCVTIAEVLKAAGYATCLSGKWHLASDMHTPNDAWPTRRGFDRFFGTLTGCGSFFQPGTLTRGEVNVESRGARSRSSTTPMRSATRRSHSFATIARRSPSSRSSSMPPTPRRTGRCMRASRISRSIAANFDAGWDALRERRMERLMEEGVLEAGDRAERARSEPARVERCRQQGMASSGAWKSMRRRSIAWTRASAASWTRLIELGQLDNTLVIFLSDNGASDEDLPLVKLERFKQRSDILRQHARDGREVRIGNDAVDHAGRRRIPTRATGEPGRTYRIRRSAITSAGYMKAGSPRR